MTKTFLKEHQRSGFTMVEMVIAVGLFSILTSIATGGLVNALRTQRTAAGLLAANSNMSLTIEQMAREIRTGSDFCTNGQICPSDEVLSFRNGNGQQVTYCYMTSAGIGSVGWIERGLGPSVGCGGYDRITGDNVDVAYLVFTLFGANSADGYPPRITMNLGVRPSDRTSGIVLDIQTTISSRLLDLPIP